MNARVNELHGILQRSVEGAVAPSGIRRVGYRGYLAPESAFELAQDWDLDSTPREVKHVSRQLNIRAPSIEAAIVCASLGHDIRYYYGGSRELRARADRSFADQIKIYTSFVYGRYPRRHGGTVAALDHFAVRTFGGPSFGGGYSGVLGRIFPNPAAGLPGATA